MKKEAILTAPEHVKILVDSYYEIQKGRIQIGNRIAMLERDYHIEEETAKLLHEKMDEQLSLTEKWIGKQLIAFAEGSVFYNTWLGETKGIGPVLASGLISGIRDINRFSNISKLWKYCGLSVSNRCANCNKRIFKEEEREKWLVNNIERAKNTKHQKKEGKFDEVAYRKKLELAICKCKIPEIVSVASKKVSGEPLEYSPFMRTLCWKIGEQFVKMGNRSFYGNLYRTFREEEERKNPQLTKLHRYNRAKRKTVKVFLSHVWIVWRQQLNLPISKPYLEERMGHKCIEPPKY